jgi:drug/metabolite transporter (DMT)-like permease
MVVAMFTLAILILPRSGQELGELFRHQPGLFWRLFLVNGLPAGLGTSLSILGIALTDAINAGFLVKLATASTILFAWIILKEKLSGLKIVVMVMMLLGAYLLTTKGQNLMPRAGDFFILGACICWSLGDVLVRRIMKMQAINADVVTIQKPLASFPVFLVLIGVSVFYSEIFGDLSVVLKCCTFPSKYMLYAIGSGFCLAVCWVYLYRTLHVATASYLTLMSMATPVLVSLLAVIFLNEKMVLIQFVGAGLILLSGIATYLSDIAYK